VTKNATTSITTSSIQGGSNPVNVAGPSESVLSAASAQQTVVSPFEFIYSEKGFSNLKKWFAQNATGSKNQFNENQFITFLRELTDLGDHQILEVFDTFDHNHQGAITFNEFFLIISLLVARETGQTTRFLYSIIVELKLLFVQAIHSTSNNRYLHGKEIFEMLMGKEGNAITFEEFSRLGFIIGLTEDQVFAILKDFNLNLFNPIFYEVATYKFLSTLPLFLSNHHKTRTLCYITTLFLMNGTKEGKPINLLMPTIHHYPPLDPTLIQIKSKLVLYPKKSTSSLSFTIIF